MAFDAVLNHKMKSRQKYGFRPPKTGRKTDVDGEPKQSILDTIKGLLEPSVPTTTIVNEGFIYFMLACWAAGTQHATGDPTAPFVLAIGFCCWRLFDKRTKRNPDGPYFGNSPIWGAVGSALLGFIFALVVRLFCCSTCSTVLYCYRKCRNSIGSKIWTNLGRLYPSQLSLWTMYKGYMLLSCH